MRISEDKQKYLAYYFDNIHSLSGLQVNAIKDMARFKGQGSEYISCCYDMGDEDYKEGYVTLLFWEPADDEDTMVFVENDFFYQELEKICNEDIKKNPDHELILNTYLNEIKITLGI